MYYFKLKLVITNCVQIWMITCYDSIKWFWFWFYHLSITFWLSTQIHLWFRRPANLSDLTSTTSASVWPTLTLCPNDGHLLWPNFVLLLAFSPVYRINFIPWITWSCSSLQAVSLPASSHCLKTALFSWRLLHLGCASDLYSTMNGAI